MEREKLGSRLGFILLSAGCAIGIGNVWKFPYLAGQYGGAAFVLFYILFLLFLGLPIMTMEFSVGRASRKSPVLAYSVLEKPGQKWHLHGYLCLIGNYLLMMFYTSVTGWMLHYFYLMVSGAFVEQDTAGVSAIYSQMLGQPLVMGGWMVLVVVLGFAINSFGLPNVFNHMPMGQLWGSLFFVFLFFASMSTILAVFENIMACWMDLTGMSRKKVAIMNLALMLVLSLPCVLGFNLWAGFQPFGDGSTIMDLEDFLVSNIWLPIGALIYLLFCTSRYGWGWKNFTQEANTGKGLKVGNWMRWYVTYLLPIVILAIFLIGINDKFHITQALFGH